MQATSGIIMPPRVVALDGDDTLWHNETMFTTSQDEFRNIVTRHVELDRTQLDEILLATERRNLGVYGYGIKGFVLSMIETAIELTSGRIPAEDVGTILGLGRAMLQYPVELIDGARDVIEALKRRDHEVWLITKGDLFDQESKIARSGLAEAFHRIEIVSEKDEATYRRLLERHGVAAEEFVMVGNSLRSDVLPVTGIGARAFHVPYHVTWGVEHVSGDLDAEFATLESLRDLLRHLGYA